MPDPTVVEFRWRRLVVVVVALGMVLVACGADPPDRRPEVGELTQQIRGMAGVVGAASVVADNVPQARVYFEIDVEVADDITGDQLAAVTNRYLDHLHSVDYRGYQTELDVRGGGNIFVIDNNDHAMTNGEQIIAQARDWVALRTQLGGATVRFHVTVSHGTNPWTSRDGGHPSGGTINLADNADYTTVAATVTTLSSAFGELGNGNWTVSAGKQHPADIKTAKRFPTPAERDVWNQLNADQSVPHIDALTINGPTTGPVWVAEQVRSRDVGVALQLARQHLLIVAALPPPVLYTAGDQAQGHVNYWGQVTAPVAITVGGCTPRTYPPAPDEQALINMYERCRR